VKPAFFPLPELTDEHSGRFAWWLTVHDGVGVFVYFRDRNTLMVTTVVRSESTVGAVSEVGHCKTE
jgi:hypothetical protein